MTLEEHAMLRLFVVASTLLVMSMGTGAARADDQPDQKPEPEKIPAPKKIEEPRIIIVEPYFPRMDTRDVWQHYGVNSFGRFVPRVINTPYGYYYSRDLQPYPWFGTRPRAIMP
jgi:hypothetical protein